MQKTLDFWRALGVIVGIVLVGSAINVVLYGASANSLALETADAYATVMDVIILAVFSYVYFKNSSVKPSARTGFNFGALITIYTFIMGFLNGYLAAAIGQTAAQPPVAQWVMWVSALSGLVIPTLVGWYLGKNK